MYGAISFTERNRFLFFCTCKKVEEADTLIESCSTCGVEAKIHLYYDDPRIEKVYASPVVVNEEKIILTTHQDSYEIVRKIKTQIRELKFKRTNVDFTFDKHTGEFFLSDGQGICENILENEDVKNIWNDSLGKLLLTDETKEETKKFIEEIFKFKNLNYLNPKDYLTPEGTYQAFIYAYCPTLEMLPYKKIDRLPFVKREKLVNVTKGNELWKIITEHASKKIKAAATTASKFDEVATWGPFIKSQDNLLFLMSKFKTPDKNTDVVFKNFPKYVSDFQKGMELILSLHKNTKERVWVNRVIKMMEEADLHTSYEVADFVADIGLNYAQIIAAEKDFKVNFENNLLLLHDELAIERARVDKKNKVFEFEKETIELEENINDYKFILARDSSKLTSIGEKMNICVGGYTPRVIRKQCIIFSIEKERTPLVCIELNAARNVQQVKMKGNKLPNEKMAELIKAWAENNEINWQGCPDLKAIK